MDRDEASRLLGQVADGTLTPAQALDRFATAPYDALAHSFVDTHRGLRTGDPEVVLAEGKTTQQVMDNVTALSQQGRVLVTRCSPEQSLALGASGRTVLIGEPPEPRGLVAVIAAGTSDGPVAEEAAITAHAFGVNVERVDDVGVAGLHRLVAARPLLDRADVVICVAGMEGALPSVLGGLVGTPLIAVPTSIGYGASFGGLAALLAMLNSCAPGVAVVNIDNGFGAGVFAARAARVAHP
ncbi:MAG: circadian phase modifier CpmA [Frankiales bacterium]|nr:circadian phase modifier CpmA [Frankiales bacterium]